MFISAGSIDALRITFSTAFFAAYDGTQPWWQKLATRVPSTGKKNVYGWVAQQMKLSKWDNARKVLNKLEHAFELVNDPFEGTINVDKFEIEDAKNLDDMWNYTHLTLPDLGIAVKKHPDQLIRTAMGNLATSVTPATAFDALALFHSAHPVYNEAGDTYRNDFTTTGGSAKPLTSGGVTQYQNFFDVWAAMSAYKGENDIPLGVKGQTLIVPPQLAKAAWEISHSNFIASAFKNAAGSDNVAAAGYENVLKGLAEPLVIEELADDPDTWYLADTSRALKPFIYQVRTEPNFVSRVNPEDPIVFDGHTYQFGTDYRGAVGVTLPFLIARGGT